MTDRQSGSFSVHHDPGRDLLRLNVSGRLTLALSESSADTTYTLPGVTSRTRLLVDCRGADLDEVDIDALRDYQAYLSAKGYPTLRTAVMVSTANRAIAELWAAVRNSTPEANSRVFVDKAAAIQWLYSST